MTKTDYTVWGHNELIERIEELESRTKINALDVEALWACECGEELFRSYGDTATSGEPYCPKCDDTMFLADDNKQPTI